MLFEVGDLQFA
ncbi:unnamed protein product, partial [Didymodactylos carnosus]